MQNILEVPQTAHLRARVLRGGAGYGRVTLLRAALVLIRAAVSATHPLQPFMEKLE